jgi:hypothetical protein
MRRETNLLLATAFSCTFPIPRPLMRDDSRYAGLDSFFRGGIDECESWICPRRIGETSSEIPMEIQANFPRIGNL